MKIPTHKDLRKEQITLLRFERALKAAARDQASGKGFDAAKLGGLAAGVAAAGHIAAEKLAQPQLAAFAEMTDAAATQTGENMLVALARIMTEGHAAFEAAAVSFGFGLLADGGRPKEEPPLQVVLSLLGLG